MYKLYEFTDFSGGLNTKSSIFADMRNPLARTFGLKAASNASNVIMYEEGLEKFGGFDAYLGSVIGTTTVITGLYEYKKTGSGGGNYFIVCAGTKVYTATAGALTEIYSGITSGELFTFQTFDNICLMMNGSELLQFNGATCTTITMTDPDSIFGTAKPKFAAIFRNRIFYGGDDTYPSRVWTPRPGTYNNFDNTTSSVDRFDISVGDGQKLMALAPLSKDLLVAYKNGSVHRISGANPFGHSVEPFRVEEISREVGCIATRTVVQVGRDQYFLGQDGLKRLSMVNDYGDVQTTDPTYEIQSEIDALNYTESVIENAFCQYIKSDRHIYLHVPTGSNTTNNALYVHDISTGSNMPREGISASYGALVDRKYYTGSYAGQIYHQLTGDNYDSAVIPSEWESKWLPLGGISNKKIFKQLRIYFETGGAAFLSIQWKIMKKNGDVRTYSATAGEMSEDLWDLGEWDTAEFDTGADTVFNQNNLGRGIAIKLKIVNNNANEYWKVSKVEIAVHNLGRVAA